MQGVRIETLASDPMLYRLHHAVLQWLMLKKWKESLEINVHAIPVRRKKKYHLEYVASGEKIYLWT